MKKLIALASAAIAFTTFADKASFPYDVSMQTRISTNETVEVSDATVSLTGTATPSTDTVAKLEMSGVTFMAVDADDWEDFVDGISGVAMLAVKDSGTATNWYGFTGSDWVALEGAVDLSKTYDVEIAFDKTAGNKVRYAVTPAGGSQIVLATNNVEWLAQGGSATQLAQIDLMGTGSISAANLASGARAAYANITSIEQDYAFDYSNVVFKIVAGSGSYGDNVKIKVTLTDGSNSKIVEQTVSGEAGTYLVDFTGQNLVPGTSYDCTVQVVADDIPTDSYSGQPTVELFASADWFGFASGVYENATADDNLTVSEGCIELVDQDIVGTITPTTASDANTKSVVEMSVDYTDCLAVTGAYENVQTALALTEDGWMCLAGGEWTAIADENIPTTNDVYATRAEFDYTGASGKVRFSVCDDDNVWHVMKNGETEWFSLAGGAAKLAGTGLAGSGKVVAIAASYNSLSQIAPTIDGSVITLKGSTDLDLSGVAAGTYEITSAAGKRYNMRWDDTAAKYAKVVNGNLQVVDGTPANGLSSYNSFALGLDPATASSKPVLDSVQNADAGKVTFSVPNVKPETEYAEVAMKVLTLESPSATTGTETVLPAGETVTINLDSTGVKYYKVKISIKTK